MEFPAAGSAARPFPVTSSSTPPFPVSSSTAPPFPATADSAVSPFYATPSPRPLAAALTPSAGGQPGELSAAELEAQRKKRQTQACEYCRQKKIRCNSDKPTCDNCKKRNLTCSYAASQSKRVHRQGYIEKLEQRLETMERLIEPLKPEGPAPPKRRRAGSHSRTTDDSPVTAMAAIPISATTSTTTSSSSSSTTTTTLTAAGGHYPGVTGSPVSSPAFHPPVRYSLPSLHLAHPARPGSLGPRVSNVVLPSADSLMSLSRSEPTGNLPEFRRHSHDEEARPRLAPLAAAPVPPSTPASGPPATTLLERARAPNLLTADERFAVTHFVNHLHRHFPILHLPSLHRQVATGTIFQPLLHSLCALVFGSLQRSALVDYYADLVRGSAVELCNYPSVDLAQALFLFGASEYGRGKVVSCNVYFDMVVRICRTLKVNRRDAEQRHGSEPLDFDVHVRTECLRRTWCLVAMVDAVESFTFDRRPKLHSEELAIGLPCPAHNWDQDLPESAMVSLLTSSFTAEVADLGALHRLVQIASRVATFKAEAEITGLSAPALAASLEYLAIEALLRSWEATFVADGGASLSPDHAPGRFFLRLFHSAVKILFYRTLCNPVPGTDPFHPTTTTASRPVELSASRGHAEVAKVAWGQCLHTAAQAAQCLFDEGRSLTPTDYHPLIGFTLWHTGTVLVQQKIQTTRAEERMALQHDIDLHYQVLRQATGVWSVDILDRLYQLDGLAHTQSPSNPQQRAYPRENIVTTSKVHAAPPSPPTSVEITPLPSHYNPTSRSGE
ncbi:hypothetical protein IWQ60_007033 [Tieghemiomyces parasiticus]|uniref:Zn(2)-C6 fungal-type domain-containing protein n=1 Tax=Tieghemiomyces parasiticus TaxID=78921 RepID=A0A9W8A3H9_9FUNG|nr:hypothetical protein IWQ60_007033 [Tieghemiomyces parasiticus]